MNHILADLILNAINANKIPGLARFDHINIHRGSFEIVLEDSSRIQVTVSQTE